MSKPVKNVAASVRQKLANLANVRRGTPHTAPPTAFTSEFHEVKQPQWRAFLSRTGLTGAPVTLKDAIVPVKEFLVPIVEAAMAGRKFPMRWTAPGPWKAK